MAEVGGGRGVLERRSGESYRCSNVKLFGRRGKILKEGMIERDEMLNNEGGGGVT